jgi:uracil phosphoribosyltransferase
VTTTMGLAISTPRPLVVPILRAGLGMLEGMVKLLPTAEVGFLGMVRNEETLEPATYAERLPDDLSDRQCFVLDPMLATGGSLGAAIDFLFARGAIDVTAICLLAAPEGIAALEKATEGRDVTIVLGALDERLNENGYMVRGLGDAGDRLYGLV